MKFIEGYRWPIIGLVLCLCLIPQVLNSEISRISVSRESRGETHYSQNSGQETEDFSEVWMGIYMQGVKVGYSHSKEFDVVQDGKVFRKSIQESWMRVSRLGGNPVEISTTQESLYDAEGNPAETIIRTKLSQNETVIKAEVKPDRIVFTAGDKITKELPYAEEFDFGVPLDKIIEADGLRAGKNYTFKILEPLTQSLIDISFEVLEEESLLVLGERITLWHIRTKMTEIFPIVLDEWIDGEGEMWKSVSDAGFLHTTSIRMPKEKALEMSDQNLDIAFSVLIESNVKFASPQEIQEVTYKVSGIPIAKIKDLPFDGESQILLDIKEDHAVIQTRSRVFAEERGIPLPVEGEEFAEYLVSTPFCQSENSEIKKVAKDIIGNEQNSWVASKKIAEWVSREIDPNYDVGFASAKEILENRQGDCSEFTVLMVALCRSVGIPARAAVGVMYGQGIFAYHMWPEVYVGEWIALDAKWLAVDKQSGEYYTDATHIKLGDSALDEGIFQEMGQAMSEVIGKLKLEVLLYIQDK
jgi:hypothetical protein